MATIGTTTKPTNSWHAYADNNPQQEAERLTMPVHGNVLELAGWIGGWNGTCRLYLCIWDDAGALLGQSGLITVANEGSGGPSGGNVQLYTGTLPSPVRLAAGVDFYVGFDRRNGDAHQVSGGTTSVDHYEGRHGNLTSWAGDLGGASGGPNNQPRRIGMYVSNYQAVAGAKVLRSGAWVDADAVQLQRSGSWADVDAIQLQRSGSWTDAQ